MMLQELKNTLIERECRLKKGGNKPKTTPRLKHKGTVLYGANFDKFKADKHT